MASKYWKDKGWKARSAYEGEIVKLAPEGSLYEPMALTYPKKTNRRIVCLDCGGNHVVMLANYTPDIILPNGVVIEVKGRFLPEDRSKHVSLRKTYPELDVRFIMAYDAKLNPRSKTRVSEWLQKNGHWALFTGKAAGWKDRTAEVLERWAQETIPYNPLTDYINPYEE